MYIIYALVDPRDNNVFYVGITDDVFQRFLQHIKCEGKNFAKNARIAELRTDNRLPIIEELERVEGKQKAEELETYWIQHFSRLREPLMNLSKASSPRKTKRTNLRIGKNVSLEDQEAILNLRQKGYPYRDIAKMLGVTYWKVQAVCSQCMIDEPQKVSNSQSLRD